MATSIGGAFQDDVHEVPASLTDIAMLRAMPPVSCIRRYPDLECDRAEELRPHQQASNSVIAWVPKPHMARRGQGNAAKTTDEDGVLPRDRPRPIVLQWQRRVGHMLTNFCPSAEANTAILRNTGTPRCRRGQGALRDSTPRCRRYCHPPKHRNTGTPRCRRNAGTAHCRRNTGAPLRCRINSVPRRRCCHHRRCTLLGGRS